MKKAEKRKQKEAKKEQKAKNPGKKRKKAPVIIAAIIIVLIVIRMVSCAFSGSAGVMVSTTNAFRGDIEENVSTSGKVASEEKDGSLCAGRRQIKRDQCGSRRCREGRGCADDLRHGSDGAAPAGGDLCSRTKSNASYNSTMTENSKSTGKIE